MMPTNDRWLLTSTNRFRNLGLMGSPTMLTFVVGLFPSFNLPDNNETFILETQ